MKNWKTTSAGITAIVGAATRIYFAVKNKEITEEVIVTSVTLFTTGIGLLFAKDFNVSHTQK